MVLEATEQDYRVYALNELKLETCDTAGAIGDMQAFFHDARITVCDTVDIQRGLTPVSNAASVRTVQWPDCGIYTRPTRK